MSKGKNAIAPANLRTSANLDFSAEDQSSAASLGLVIAGSPEDQIGRAAMSLNMAARLAVEAGYNLLAAKASLPHGEFSQKLEEIGFSPYRAAEAMRRAKFVTAQPPERRAELIHMQPSKLLVLADASDEAVEALLEDEGVDPSELSVRALREKVRQLEKKAADAAVDRSTAEAEAEGLRKQLAAAEGRVACGSVPVVVADLRAELAAMVKKAELSVDGLAEMGRELQGLQGTAVDEWVKPSAQLCLAGLVALRVQVDGVIDHLAESLAVALPADKKPDALSCLSDAETETVARQWASLVQQHKHESALRQYERDQERPKGKGRPKAAPKSPE